MKKNHVALRRLLNRQPDANKGDFGRGLLIGGSRDMSGAIAIAGLAALRCGTGLTTVATPRICQATVAAIHPVLMTTGLACDRLGRISAAAEPKLLRLIERSTAAAIGPGLGRSPHLNRLVDHIYRTAPIPLVVDADALNAIAKSDWQAVRPPGPRILTPHPGEFERLSGVDSHDRPGQITAAGDYARKLGITIVLKGCRTVVASGDGEYTNSSGNAKMAVGGSGDLLTGMILAFVCQGLDPFEAACGAVHLHGVAGDIAAQRLGCPSVLATDMIDDLPAAFTAVS